MSDYEFIPYFANSEQRVKYPHDSLAFALESMEDGEGAGDFLHSVYFTTDPNVVVVAPKNGPFTTPPSKQQERFCYELDGGSGKRALFQDETFDGGGSWFYNQTWRHLSVEQAADFIREWIVTA